MKEVTLQMYKIGIASEDHLRKRLRKAMRKYSKAIIQCKS
jgi:hypothetical protein